MIVVPGTAGFWSMRVKLPVKRPVVGVMVRDGAAGERRGRMTLPPTLIRTSTSGLLNTSLIPPSVNLRLALLVVPLSMRSMTTSVLAGAM